jgi:hypothetical protein
MTRDLTDDEARALAKQLRSAIDNHRFPLAPPLAPMKAPSPSSIRQRRSPNRCAR